MHFWYFVSKHKSRTLRFYLVGLLLTLAGMGEEGMSVSISMTPWGGTPGAVRGGAGGGFVGRFSVKYLLL